MFEAGAEEVRRRKFPSMRTEMRPADLLLW